MNVIKSAFLDAINWVLYCKEYKPKAHKEIEVEPVDTSKEDIIKYFHACHSYKIEHDTFYFIVDKSDEEIKKESDENLKRMVANISLLRHWCSINNQDREQIYNYLQSKKLDWIIEELS